MMRRLAPIALVLALAACGDRGGGPAEIDGAPAAIDAASIDAAPAVDAGPAPDAPELGVYCGPEAVLCTPDTSQGCCEEKGLDPRCEPNGGLCLGTLTSCDGREDCPVGDICCDYGFGPGCGANNDCTADLGGTPVCHTSADCIPATPNCCDERCTAQACEP